MKTLSRDEEGANQSAHSPSVKLTREEYDSIISEIKHEMRLAMMEHDRYIERIAKAEERVKQLSFTMFIFTGFLLLVFILYR